MSIYLVTGPPGSGKSLFAVRTKLGAVRSGKWCASNVRLHDGWQHVLARQNWLSLLIGGKRRVERQADLYDSRMFVSHSLSELFSLRLPPCGKCRACRNERTCQKEERGVMVLDEAHEWLNARTWDQAEDGREISKAEAVANRLAIVKFFALHRKLGWRIYLITQDEKRLDNQVRGNFEFHVRLKNMRRWKLWGIIKVFFFDYFVALTYWHALGSERVAISSYFLERKVADLYDTMARPEMELGEEEGVIHMPLTREEREARARGEWSGRTAGRPERGSAPDGRPTAPSPSTRTRPPRSPRAAAAADPAPLALDGSSPEGTASQERCYGAEALPGPPTSSLPPFLRRERPRAAIEPSGDPGRLRAVDDPETKEAPALTPPGLPTTKSDGTAPDGLPAA